jgi:hypothetical protein
MYSERASDGSKYADAFVTLHSNIEVIKSCKEEIEIEI